MERNNELSTSEELQAQFRDTPIMFMKFSKNIEHLKMLQSGSLYMNNLKYYVELEEKNGVPGMGDKLEAMNVMNEVNLSFYIPGTDRLIRQATAKTTSLRYQDALYKPVFCLFSITIDMLEVIEETESFVSLKLNFSKEQLAEMEKEFGKHVLLISRNALHERIEKSFKEREYEWQGKPAEYLDYTLNHMNVFQAYANRSTDLFFYKNKKFEHQKEYRIVIFNKDEEEAITEKIDTLEDVSYLTTTDSLNSEGEFLRINYKKQD